MAIDFSLFISPCLATIAVLLDYLLGEPRRWHPLVGFGNYVQRLELVFNRNPQSKYAYLWGFFTWSIAVLPFIYVAYWLRQQGQLWQWGVDVGLLYFTLGARSLGQHAEAVRQPLEAGDLATARTKVGWMVSRDTTQLDASGVSKAAMESVLENGNDAIFGTLFWFFVWGAPGALLFRFANTLDAMWGYRTPRFSYFGWMAARFDDVLNYLPARLTALSYALLGQTRLALRCWWVQAPTWDSPNAGPVMAAGAGSLGVLLGGSAIYHGKEELRPPLGAGAPPAAQDLHRAMCLIQQSLCLWLLVAWGIATALVSVRI